MPNDSTRQNVTETDEWKDGIYQYATNDFAIGGPDGILTLPIKELASRTKFLKERQKEIQQSIPGTEEFSKLYKELAALDISKLEKRMDHVERNLGDITLVMDANMMYPNGDAYLGENFDDADKVDLTEVTVTSSMKGDDSIDVDSGYKNLVIGANYILTDGITQEQVQIKSINISGTTYRVILTGAIVNQYDNTRAKLYRSNIVVYDGKAYSGGNMKVDTYEPAIDFKGSTTQKDITATFGDFQNEKDYELHGMIIQDGKMVLGSRAIGIAFDAQGGRTGTWSQIDENGDDLQ